ncbi:MAG TPA: DUF5985 family protein [Thermoanaerobaculia bacterium]|jgi:hypothetical protein|nr:DUF5985 family protein [Thermoanaerobaculia bacterium]
MSSVALPLVAGFLVMGFAVAALFFLRFWRESRDRLFLLFSAAFFLLGVDRVIASTSSVGDAVYLLRALAFVLILAAVVDKNRR